MTSEYRCALTRLNSDHMPMQARPSRRCWPILSCGWRSTLRGPCLSMPAAPLRTAEPSCFLATWFGKTSLVAALVKAGAQYYSDEYAVLDERGLVHPYPRSLRVRSRLGGTTERVPVTELGGTAGDGPAAVNLIAAVRYDGEIGWDVSPVSRSHAALQLLTHTVGAKSNPEAALHAIQQAMEGSLAVEGVRGEADDAASRLLRMLDGLQASSRVDSNAASST